MSDTKLTAEELKELAGRITPGPWTHERVNMPQLWDFSRVVTAEKHEIADIDNTGWPEETEIANAELIALAPSLLQGVIEAESLTATLREELRLTKDYAHEQEMQAATLRQELYDLKRIKP